MGIKRYFINKDCDITNSYKEGLVYSGSLSNDGQADSLQIFSIYNQTGFETSTLFNRKSRILLELDFTDFIEDISNQVIPIQNNQYFIKLFNVKHHENLPKGFELDVMPLSRSFNEGLGLDQDNFTDLDEANWYYASTGTAWTNPGGDFYSASTTYIKSQYFKNGDEDLEVDITDIINDFCLTTSSGFPELYGIGIKLNDSYEDLDNSYYKKKFSARSSEYFFKRPVFEVRWDSSRQDDRNNSFISSSLASTENINSLYFVNEIHGIAQDIPNFSSGSNIYVHFYNNSLGSGSAQSIFTGSWVETGVYKVDFYSTYTGTLYDFWKNSSGNITYYSSSIRMKSFYDYSSNSLEKYDVSMPYFKSEFSIDENPRLDVFIKKKNTQPNYYIKYQQIPENHIIENCYYKIKRVVDDLIVVNYGTGSVNHTKLSYDSNGNYFNFPMNLLEQGYMYELSYLFKFGSRYLEQQNKFKFKVI